MGKRFQMAAQLCVLAALLVSSGTADSDRMPQYRIVDLGLLRGGSGAHVTGINDAGDVVGVQNAMLQDRTMTAPWAFAYDGDDDDINDLGSLGGSMSAALAINAGKRVVGYSSLSDDLSSPWHAFLYDGVIHDLGTLGGGNSEAYGINNRGEIVGRSIDVVTHAFFYDGVLHDIGTLGGTYSEARAINDSGQIVGCSTTSGSKDCHAFLYDGGMHDLGTLGGKSSFARAINSQGNVVGAAQRPDGTLQAFLYDGSLHALGFIERGATYALAINDNNQVVGRWISPNGARAGGFLYQSGKLYDLKGVLDATGDPWQSLIEASGINQSGSIVGTGVMQDGVHAFQLYPVQADEGS